MQMSGLLDERPSTSPVAAPTTAPTPAPTRVPAALPPVAVAPTTAPPRAPTVAPCWVLVQAAIDRQVAAMIRILCIGNPPRNIEGKNAPFREWFQLQQLKKLGR